MEKKYDKLILTTKEKLIKMNRVGLLSNAFLKATINDMDRAIKIKQIEEERNKNGNKV